MLYGPNRLVQRMVFKTFKFYADMAITCRNTFLGNGYLFENLNFADSFNVFCLYRNLQKSKEWFTFKFCASYTVFTVCKNCGSFYINTTLWNYMTLRYAYCLANLPIWILALFSSAFGGGGSHLRHRRVKRFASSVPGFGFIPSHRNCVGCSKLYFRRWQIYGICWMR